MNKEANSNSVPSFSCLEEHPIFKYLLDNPGQLNKESTMNDRTVYPPQGAEMKASIVSRVTAIAEFFNNDINQDHWQLLCEKHPAADAIKMEISQALKLGQYEPSADMLRPIMDRLDAAGFMTSFDKQSQVFSITFQDRGLALVDAQRDVKNKGLLDRINWQDDLLNPQGGWYEPNYRPGRMLHWRIAVDKTSMSPWFLIMGEVFAPINARRLSMTKAKLPSFSYHKRDH